MFPRRSEPPHLWQVPHTSPDEPAEFPSDADLLDLLLLDLRTRIEFECTPRCGADSIVTRGGNRRRRLTGRVATRCGSSARPTPGGTSRLRLSSSLLLIQLSHFTHLVSGESSGWGPRIPFLAISREIPQTTNPVYAVPGTGTGSFTRAPSANFTFDPFENGHAGMNTSTQESREVCPPDIRHSGRSKFGFFPRARDDEAATVWRMTIARSTPSHRAPPPGGNGERNGAVTPPPAPPLCQERTRGAKRDEPSNFPVPAPPLVVGGGG